MEPIKKIQRRIRQRQNHIVVEDSTPISEKVEDIDKEKKGFAAFAFKFSTRILIVTSLLLGFLIYAKNDPKATFVKDTFGYQLDLSYVNGIANGFVNKLLNYDIFRFINNGNNDGLVNAAPVYLSLGNNKFTNEDGKTYSIGSGKVAFVGEGVVGQKVVIIKTVYNVVVTYVDVNEVFVHKNDWVDNKDIIGTFNNELLMYFSFEGESITYAKVVEIIEQAGY